MSNQDLKTKAGYLAFHSECCDKMKEITKRKNSDYTGNSTDPFANFQSVSKIGICSTEQGFMVRMMDKLMRIRALTVDEQTAQVKDEAIEDTLLDLANYSILLAGFLRAKTQNGTTTERGEPASVYKVGMRVFCPYLKLSGTIMEDKPSNPAYEFYVRGYSGGTHAYTADGRYSAAINDGHRLEILREPTNNT